MFVVLSKYNYEVYMTTVRIQSRWLLAILVALLANQAFGHGMSEAEKHAITEGGNLRYIWIGATHMLSGYDHLAFVFGIVFFLTKFKEIVKYVTAFTLGHSVTLIWATFNAIQINYYLIDAVIALSVCYIAFVNLDGFKKYLNINPPNMILMITGMGLIHGLGLSTRLQQLPLNQDQLLMNIISFNVGIEVGQISALAMMLMLLAAFRKSHIFKNFSLIANYGLVLAGALLFLIQMHDYEHSKKSIENFDSAEAELSMDDFQQLSDVGNTKEISWNDFIVLKLPARSETEYKLHLAKGATLEYSWKTDKGELFYDLHGDPTGDTTGYFKSFQKDTEGESSGVITSEFDGPHGWYWKNNNSHDVSIILKVKGEYSRLDLKNNMANKGSADLPWKDEIRVEIPARGEKEYKLHLKKGSTLQYSWKTSDEKLFFDFHGEPTGDTTGFFKSFQKNTLSQSSGSLTSEFDGTHGWYWKNNSAKSVVIILKVAGEYSRLDLKKKSMHNSID